MLSVKNFQLRFNISPMFIKEHINDISRFMTALSAVGKIKFAVCICMESFLDLPTNNACIALYHL